MNNITAADVLNEKNEAKQRALYQKYVKAKTPTTNMALNLFNAFWIGGLICLLGQALTNLWISLGIGDDDARLYTTLSLILISVIMTALGWYASLAKLSGAGTVVPITGFANSISSAAIEYKKEGQVFGIGCQIFSIAGPVILYGIFASWCLGLIYWLLDVSSLL